MRSFVKNRVAGEKAGAGKLNLLISGFGRQALVSTDEIVWALDALPGFHLEGLREIVYLPEYRAARGAFSPAGFHGCDPKGEFVQRERRIFLYSFDSRALFFHMLHHEIGHFVFFLAIGSRVKKRWVGEVFPGSACVTPYAAKNPWEDFAETYAHYVLHPRRLAEELPDKHAFMRDYVFSGAVGTLKESDHGG